MSDLDILARRAGDAARAEARERLTHLDAPTLADPHRVTAPRRRPVVLVAASLVLVAAVVAAVVSSDAVRIPVIEPAEPPVEQPDTPEQPTAVDGVLPAPEVGEALAAYLDDGTPVFVSHPKDGEVVVLDAEDPRAPWGWRRLVSYCPQSGWFEELRHGSRFNGWGQYTGGPSPAGLAAYPSELAPDGQTVRVIGPVGEHPPRDTPDLRRQDPGGPPCSNETDARPMGGGATVHHVPPTDAPVSAGEGLSPDRWTWARLMIGGRLGDAVLCADDACTGQGLAIHGLEPQNPFTLLTPVRRTMLARLTDQGTVAFVLPATDVDGPHPLQATEHDVLARPPAGQASAAYLPDGAPVFVVHDTAGRTHLADATSPDTPSSLLAWCPGVSAFVDGSGSTFAVTDLAPYPIALVDQGDHVGVRVTGDRDTDAAPAPTRPDVGDCDGAVVHAPPLDFLIAEPGNHAVSRSWWTWARMEIRASDGVLYLCASRLDGCVSGSRRDASAACEDLGTDADPEPCEPFQDPRVTTSGATATDGRQLFLVRQSPHSNTVDIRIPPDVGGPS